MLSTFLYFTPTYLLLACLTFFPICSLCLFRYISFSLELVSPRIHLHFTFHISRIGNFEEFLNFYFISFLFTCRTGLLGQGPAGVVYICGWEAAGSGGEP